MRKTYLKAHKSCSVQKTPKYSRNETILKIGHLAEDITHAKAIAFAKWSVWVKNKNSQKHAQNGCTKRRELFCAKNRWRKHQIFEKWEHFENRPSCKGYSQWKGYSLCKMVSLGQKLKWPKTWVKRLYRKTRVVLCKKAVEKTPNIPEMRGFWKSAILQRL